MCSEKEVQKEFVNIYYANYIWLHGSNVLFWQKQIYTSKVKEKSRLFTNSLVLFDKFKKRGGKCQEHSVEITEIYSHTFLTKISWKQRFTKAA